MDWGLSGLLGSGEEEEEEKEEVCDEGVATCVKLNESSVRLYSSIADVPCTMNSKQTSKPGGQQTEE